MSGWNCEPGGADAFTAMQALRGVRKPAYVAGVMAFLAGPDGTWVTGQVVDAGGGTKLLPAERLALLASAIPRDRSDGCPTTPDHARA